MTRAKRERLIFEVVRRIPRGRVATYGQVAMLADLRAQLRRRMPDDAASRQKAFGVALACDEARRLAEQGALEAARQVLDHAVKQGAPIASVAPGDPADE